MDLGLKLITILVAGGFLSWLLGFTSQRLARRFGVMDKPGGRKMHDQVTPLLGGVGIAVTIILATLGTWSFGWLQDRGLSLQQIIGFLSGVVIITGVGMLDDRYDLKPSIRFFFYTVAVLAVILTGSTILQVTDLKGFGAISLVWSHWAGFKFPADALTLIWMLLVIFAVKFVDGIDGLVTGQTVIGGAVIGGLALTITYFQPPVAILAMIVLAAYLGFFPHNFHPAKQFLGESGSVLAGYSLAFLSVVSGTKVATALMVLGLPLIDIILVIAGRLRRGVPPWQGDRTHLHHKLLAAGLTQTQAVSLLWLISLVFGLAALGLQTRGKLMLLFALSGLTLALSFVAGWLAKRKSQL